MSHLLAAITDLVKGIFNLFAAFFTTLYGIVQTFVLAIVHFFTSILSMVVDLVTGLVELAGGVLNFVLGNILILGILGGISYVLIQTNRGRPVTVGGKKIN